jgi:hypothetical protein
MKESADENRGILSRAALIFCTVLCFSDMKGSSGGNIHGN